MAHYQEADDWFTRLTGFSERSPENVRQLITVDDEKMTMTSIINHVTYQFGRLEIPSLEELRQRRGRATAAAGATRMATASQGSNGDNVADDDGGGNRRLSLMSIVGDAKSLHADSSNAGATFQVASQFNLLEMASPTITPEFGVGIYEHDLTQGPACAIACGAGTIYRNYFVRHLNKDKKGEGGQRGQTESKQINCLFELGQALGNTNNNRRLWEMKNGYALPSLSGLEEVANKLMSMSEGELDVLRGKLRIGIQWDTQVTLIEGCCRCTVTQVYCSALPVAYSHLPHSLWEPFARLVLEATYEATFAVAVENALRTGNRTLYLTSVGGGAFGNETCWIEDAIRRACHIFRESELDVKIVCFRSMDPGVEELVRSFNKGK